jgi:alkanesulfonate monooxygenase SsuD/methylene tetrahydromethanopterin reductase-like flavin-dependent oxidoreductase (luciferase family)
VTRTGARGAVVCFAVKGRFLQAAEGGSLRAEARRAEADGTDAVIVGEGPLGDPVVLAAGLSPLLERALVGVRVTLRPDGRHPAVLARDLTALDLVCGGRSLVCLGPPFAESTAEAIELCRALWREGHATSEGPSFPVHGAVNRPLPASQSSPRVALDLTGGEQLGDLPGALGAAVDLVVWPTGDDAVCRIERP